MEHISVRRVAVLVGFAVASSFSNPVLAQVPSNPSTRMSTVKVGDRAPAFSLVGSDGRTYRLTELQGKKRLVLVIFRGVW